MEFKDLSKRSQKRITKALAIFNQYYNKATRSVKMKLQNDATDFLEELKILKVIPYQIPSFYYRSGAEKKFDDEADSFFYENKLSPTGIVSSQLPLALHMVNNTHIKIKEYVDQFQKMVRNNPNGPPFLPNSLSKGLKRRCRQYLCEIPNKISYNNIEGLATLTKKFEIPSLHYNYNHDLIDMLEKAESSEI